MDDMMEAPPCPRNKRRPRILTIDNGGLQAISILLVLQDVCKALSEAEGSTELKAPYQLFDIIGGVGSGGWLAILLGRYKLTIGQCMGIYMMLANDLDPTKKGSNTRAKSQPAALDQSRLMEKIDAIIEQHGIDADMVDTQPGKHHHCHAFALGVIKDHTSSEQHSYHLFRTYELSGESNAGSLNPTNCKVSEACAATAAARDFCNEFKLGNTVYWDDTFPHTHPVSQKALEEATLMYGDHEEPEFVLNISPGIATEQDNDCLQKFAHKNASATKKLTYHLRRAFSVDGKAATFQDTAQCLPKSQSEPTLGLFRRPKRTDSNTSNSSREREAKHRQALQRYLEQQYGSPNIYQRLSLGELQLTKADYKPYLNDVSVPDEARTLATKFLQLPGTASIIQTIVARAKAAGDGEVPELSNDRCVSPAPLSRQHTHTGSMNTRSSSALFMRGQVAAS